MTAKSLWAWNGRASDHFVDRNSDRIKVGSRIRQVAVHLLGRHVAQRAGRRSGHRQRAIFARAGDAEIHEFHDTLSGENDVGRLDVAMDDVLSVRVAQGIQNLVDVFSVSVDGMGPEPGGQPAIAPRRTP